jgi:hypothetical protein
MRALTLTVAALLACAVNASAQSPSCPTQHPGPGFVCVGGQWLPPGHPSIPTTPPPAIDVPPPSQPAPPVPFRIGRRYVRGTTDVYIAGAGQLRNGLTVLFAECLQLGDGCYAKGEVRMFLSNATAVGWTDATDSPY